MASIYGNGTADGGDWWSANGYVDPSTAPQGNDIPSWTQNPDGSWTGSGGLDGRTVQIPAGYDPHARPGEPGYYNAYGLQQIDEGAGRLGTQPVVPRQQMPPTTSSDTPQPTSGSLAGLTQPATTTQPQDFGNLDASGWMALVRNPTQLAAWFKQQNPALTDAEVQYFVEKAQGQPGANAAEQAGGAQYWGDKARAGNQGGSVGAMGPFYGVGAFNPAAPFNGLPSDFTQDPSYQWRFGQGQEALENSAAARGTLLTGGALKDLVNYGQGAASQEYGAQFNRGLALNQNAFTQGLATNQNAFNQGMGVNQNLFNQNYSLAGLGLNATNSGINGAGGQAANATSFAGNVAGPYANAAGNNLTGIGNAQAAGTVGSQNAYNNLYGLYSGLFR